MTDIEIGPAGHPARASSSSTPAPSRPAARPSTVLEAGEVLVNGEIERRRGRQLGVGDDVAVGDRTWRLV